MDATTSDPITSLVRNIRRDYPDLSLREASTFAWRPETATLTYDPTGKPADLLHELAHAVLGHKSYTRDVELLQIERDAWDYAQVTLSKVYAVTISDDVVQHALDSYRDWIHARSRCPHCEATGAQIDQHHYKCPACYQVWRVNDSRMCELRRYRK